MFAQLEIFRMAQGLARHAAARQRAVAQNVANVNTPGYRKVDIPGFAALHGARVPAEAPGMRATRPGHFGAGPAIAGPEPAPPAPRPSPRGEPVSLEDEILKAAQLRRDHELALSIYRSTMTVLRTGIGRR